jgi:peptide/nickel transport system permease protein
MKTVWLVGQKVGHFLAVLFLSSLVLAGFLWFSPGSPGKARDPVVFDKVVVDTSRVCLTRTDCGILRSVPIAPPKTVEVLFGDALRRIPVADLALEDGGPIDYDTVALRIEPVCVQGECGVLTTYPESGPKLIQVEIDGVMEEGRAMDALAPGPGFLEWFLGIFWRGVLIWDVGPAFNGEPVLDLVLEGAKYTIPIVFGALFLAVFVGLLQVAFLTWLPFPSLRGFLRTLMLGMSTAPVFIIGYFMTKAGILPNPDVWWIAPLACIAILSIGDSNLGELLLQMEGEVRRLRSQDYIHAAGLRGASAFKHMLPGLVLPLSSIGAAKIAFLLGSVVIAEVIYSIPGLGELSLKAAVKPDPLLLVAITVFITAAVAFVALLRDLLEIAIDPRVRKAQEGG